MRTRLALIGLIALTSLSACGSGNKDAGGVSPEEDRLLNEAASSLDANFMAVPDNAAADTSSDQGNAQ